MHTDAFPGPLNTQSSNLSKSKRPSEAYLVFHQISSLQSFSQRQNLIYAWWEGVDGGCDTSLDAAVGDRGGLMP